MAKRFKKGESVGRCVACLEELVLEDSSGQWAIHAPESGGCSANVRRILRTQLFVNRDDRYFLLAMKSMKKVFPSLWQRWARNDENSTEELGELCFSMAYVAYAKLLVDQAAGK